MKAFYIEITPTALAETGHKGTQIIDRKVAQSKVHMRTQLIIGMNNNLWHVYGSI